MSGGTKAAEPHSTGLLHELQERTKELNCLYQAEELLTQRNLPLKEVLQGIADILPSAWQYPEECQARIACEDVTVCSAGYAPSPWTQSAPINVDGHQTGEVQVSYRSQLPPAHEGPFLREERQLLRTLAERIAAHIVHRRLRSAFERLSAAADEPEQDGSRAVLEFLRDTDPVLLQRISRKLINHLSYAGVQQARGLLERLPAPDVLGDNRPWPAAAGAPADLSQEAFAMAAEHMSGTELLGRLSGWIKEEKSSFLVRALEDQDTSLGEVLEAIERYHHAGIDEHELPAATQQGIRAALARRIFSENRDFLKIAKKFIGIADYYELLGRIVFPPRCHGKLGGKSAGLFLAKRVIEKKAAHPLLRNIRVPKTWYLTSDWILHFVQHNELDDVLNWKYKDLEEVRQQYPHLVSLFKKSAFPSELAKGLSLALEEFGDAPVIVRSSTLLEDLSGAAFSGKYKSLFLGNRGSKEERLAALMDAIAEVYASIFGPDPTEYRAGRGLLDVHEEMGIMIQEVVGRRMGAYFMPVCSGVAFSHNDYRWSARILRSDGLVRMVPGLGTRAVDRLADDYPVLIAPGQPNLRANVTVEEVLKYSPKRVDLINLTTNAFETVDTADLLQECGRPSALLPLISLVHDSGLQQPIGVVSDLKASDVVFTFDGLIRDGTFVARIRLLLDLLQSELGTAVDLEFAYNGDDFYLLQCRPQSFSGETAPVPIPDDLPAEKVLFSANRFVSNGSVPDITHVVYVDLEHYSRLASEASMREVGRVVGRLNRVLPHRRFLLIGPGRWGSRGDIRLGVPVTYSDISNTAMLIEVARQKGNYVPELSFGTHFFQDLVESAIPYLPLYPDEPNTVLQERFFTAAPNGLRELLPEAAPLEETIRVLDIPRITGGQVLRVLMNAELDRAVGFLASPRA